MGHLAADPTSYTTTTGKNIVTFPVATNRYSKDKKDSKYELVDFHRVVAWNGLAEISMKHLAKGSAVYLEGRLKNDSYKDKDGNNRYRTEIVSDTLNIISWKNNTQGKEEAQLQELNA
jgi:single-strand DNA-binding protein